MVEYSKRHNHGGKRGQKSAPNRGTRRGRTAGGGHGRGRQSGRGARTGLGRGPDGARTGPTQSGGRTRNPVSSWRAAPPAGGERSRLRGQVGRGRPQSRGGAPGRAQGRCGWLRGGDSLRETLRSSTQGTHGQARGPDRQQRRPREIRRAPSQPAVLFARWQQTRGEGTQSASDLGLGCPSGDPWSQ